ncbi:transient receptor potential channel pyrexia-like [Tribolium madens]|uniref:transient receptor potential channel pyrexia-like n=1 Tax=Tribolium madens TaxID=41895 RepID=UPI001CF73F61|nr:transient receptor potential channel pyrexia-like [Tribolium madens]
MICSKRLVKSEKQRKLLKYVRNNDIKAIVKLLKHNNELLWVEYHHPFDNQNIFIIACNDGNSMHDVKGATISTLIDLGANYTQPTKNDHWEAIHYAAVNANAEKLQAIVQHLTVQEANSLVYCSKHVPSKYPFRQDKTYFKSYSNNALSVILKYGKRSETFYECCQLLIQKGVNVDQVDSNGLKPLDLIKKDKRLVAIFEECNKCEKFCQVKNTFELAKLRQVEEFLKLDLSKEEANDVDGSDEAFSSCTLLQLCCAKGLTSCVKHLLDKGANPNKTFVKNTNSPIMIAIKEDHEDIVRLLLENPDLVLPEDILIKLQIKYKNVKNFARIDKYMELVLKHLHKYDKSKLSKYLLAKDELNRTALHYATHYRCSENILELLSLGAPLTEKDLFGFTPMHSIEASVLEQFFDNCINVPKNEKDIDNMLYELRNKKQKFAIEINYESLIGVNGESDVHESEFLDQLVKLKNLTYLLNHPVISSYLSVKWRRFRWAVYVNLLLYFIAYGSLLFYGFAYSTYSTTSNSLLIVSVDLMFMLEFLQMLIFRTDYIKRVENIIDIILIAGVVYIIAAGWFETLLNQNLRVAFSIVFLTSTLGIFMQLGNLPFFTVKVIILKQICISFCKYMIFYVFPVMAFFFCFYMLRETDEDVFFQTLYDVTTMFAGDPDSNYPQQFSTNPIFSHIIYVVFIVLIGIILQNLLIGLAVSDLQEIQKEAQFIDKKERAHYITNIERVIFGKYRESSYKICKRFFRKLLRMCNVFTKDRVLVIQPYNYGCVYVKDNPGNKQYIRDQTIIDLLQNIFKDLFLNKNQETEAPYSLKVIYDRLQRIEYLLEKLDLDELLKK